MAARQFADVAAEQYFRNWVTTLQQRLASIQTLQEIAPPELAATLTVQYRSGTPWMTLIKSLSLDIIMRAGTPITLQTLKDLRSQFERSKTLLTRTASSRGRGSSTSRIKGAQLKYATARPVGGPLPRTFMISGQGGLDHGPLRYLLAELGFQEIILGGEPVEVGLFLLEQAYHYNPQERLRYDPRTSGVTCALKNLLPPAKECLTNKAQLYTNLNQLDPLRTAQYLATTSPLRNLETVPPGQLLILKPVGNQAGCGLGIEIVSNTKELRRARQRILEQYPDGIASEYIRMPLLLEGKKLHLRMYFLVRGPIRCDWCGSSGVSCPVCFGRPALPAYFELFERGKILTALKPYEDQHFTDPMIHDTHVKSTSANYYFPEDLARCHGFDGTPVNDVLALSSELLDQMREILGVAAGVMLERMDSWHYPESNFGYEVFGCDFMVRSVGSTRTIVLLEINDRVGNKPCTEGIEPENWPPAEGPGIYAWDLEPYQSTPYYPSLVSHAHFSGLYWDWILNQAILPVYAQFEPPSL